MIIEGEFSFNGPRETVWALLQDPDVMSRALPGTKRLDRTEEDKFEGEMVVGVGPVTAAEFKVTVSIAEKAEPESFTLSIDGKGKLGFTKGSAEVKLSEQEDGSTVMQYRADLKIGGKIASVGQRLLDSVSKSMTKQGLEALNQEVQDRMTEAATGAPMSRRSPRANRLWIAAVAVAVVIVALILLF